MDGFTFLVAVVTFVMALVALNKLSKLETRLHQLKFEFGNLSEELGRLRTAGVPVEGMAARQQASAEETPATSAHVEDVSPATLEPVEAEVLAETAPDVPEPSPPELLEPQRPAAAKPDMEQALASRWFVWIGGVAIAIGGLLFVKYAYDNGLISPTLQIVLGVLVGLALVAAGELVRRAGLRSDERETSYVPAALSAAGLAVLFGSIYAAYALYGLVDPTVAFIGLAVTGLGGLALSRWQGPLIAALGLAGSYVTPALIGSPDPSAVSFFPYLAVILGSCFLTLRGRNWWWLGYAGLAGAFIWTALWIAGPFEAADVWPVGLFALLMGLFAAFGLSGVNILREESGRTADPSSISPQLAIALAGLVAQTVLLILLVLKAAHDPSALILLALGLVGLTGLGWLKHGLTVLAPAAALVMFLVLMAWPEAAFHALTTDEFGMWSWSNSFGPETARFQNWMLISGVFFTLTGIAGVILRPAARSWGATGGAAAFLFVWGAWARTDFLLSSTTWTLLAAVFAGALLGGAILAKRRSEDPEVDLGAGLLAVGAAALVVFGLDRMLDGVWFTIGIAAAALAFALLSPIVRAMLMGPVTAALGSLAALRLFLSRELWLDDRTLPLGQHWVLYGYGVPAVLLYAASRILRSSGHHRSSVALEGISLGLLISLVSLEIRVLIGGGYLYDEPQFLEMSAHILTWLGAAYGLMHRQRFYSSFIALWGSRVLLVMSFGAIALLSLVALNPVVTEEPVPGNIVFNALLLAYLAPVILIGLIATRLDAIGWGEAKPALGIFALVLVFVYVTLETKRIFQGPAMVAWSLSVAESYAYSAVWLALALGLFVAGIKMGRGPCEWPASPSSRSSCSRFSHGTCRA